MPAGTCVNQLVSTKLLESVLRLMPHRSGENGRRRWLRGDGIGGQTWRIIQLSTVKNALSPTSPESKHYEDVAWRRKLQLDVTWAESRRCPDRFLYFYLQWFNY